MILVVKIMVVTRNIGGIGDISGKILVVSRIISGIGDIGGKNIGGP